MSAGIWPAAFDEHRYVPILLTRQGERLALREIAANIRAAMTPLFVVHPVARDPQTNAKKVTEEVHLTKLAKALVKDWGIGAAFVDLRWIDTDRPATDSRHLVEFFLDQAAQLGLRLAPALSTQHSPDYRAAAIRAADAHDTAVALRLSPDEWHDVGSPVGDGRVLGLLGETGRSADQVHLMVDVEDGIASTISLALAAVRPVLRNFPRINEWASVTIAGTGMPVGTAQVGPDGSGELARVEWLLWRALNDRDLRRTSFGDYGVQHPNPLSDFNPLYMDSSAQLRYTISGSWFVARGRGVKRVGNEQIRGLAQQVVDHAEYSGPAFSWGDDWLDQCAREVSGPGAQSVWRKVTTNHHLTFVVRQLASLFGP